MRCDTVQQLVSLRFDGEARPTIDHAAVDAHVSACPACRRFAADAERLRRELRLTGLVEPVDVVAAVDAALDHPGPIPTGGNAVTADRWTRRRGLAVAAAAAVAVAGLATAFAVGRSTAPTTVEVTERPPSLGPTTTTDPTSGAAVSASPAAIPPELAVVWTADVLDPALQGGLPDLAGVAATAFVRRAEIGLVGSVSADGEPVDDLDDGWAIPIDVVAVDPEPYGELFDNPAVAQLGPEQALLGTTAATLRRVGVGGLIHLDRGSVEVVGIVDDALIGGAELAVDLSTGEALGVTDVRYALIGLEPGAGPGVPPELRAAIDARTDRPFRLRTALDAPILRNDDAVLPLAELKAELGELSYRRGDGGLTIDPQWYDEAIVTTELPLIGSVTCHRLVVGALDDALRELIDTGLDDLVDSARFEGCYNPRHIRTSDELSRHSWGGAVDFGGADEPPPSEVVAVLERWGFEWGGDWLIPDGGHFEYVGRTFD